MKKNNLLQLLLLVFVICCLCGCSNSKETAIQETNIQDISDTKFQDVAHICNYLGGLPGMQIVSPKIINVWYFEDSDSSGKDVVICFTGANTSSNYYQFFTLNDDNMDFLSVAYAKDEVNASAIVTGRDDTTLKLYCAALMLQAMEEQNKLPVNQIEELNKLLSSGKIAQYKSTGNKNSNEKDDNNIQNELIGTWTLEMKTESQYDTSIISTYTFKKNGEFSLYNYMTLKGSKMTDLASENGKYSIDEKQSIIKLEFDNKETTLPKEIHYSYDNGTFIFNDSYSGENRYIKK